MTTQDDVQAADLDSRFGWWAHPEGQPPVRINHLTLHEGYVRIRAEKHHPWSREIPAGNQVRVTK